MALIGGAPAKRPRAAAPLWTDPDDEAVALVNVPGGRKLRRQVGEEELAGPVYEARLREQFEAVLPTPDWAKAKRGGLSVPLPRTSSRAHRATQMAATRCLPARLR